MPDSPALSHKDEALIALLDTNARMSTTALAKQLGVSRSTVQDRLRKLETHGVIAGYGVRLGAAVATEGIRAHVAVAVEPRMTEIVVNNLSRMPNVETLQTVAGKFDLVAMVHASTTRRVEEVLDNIGQTEGVIRTESMIILSSRLDRRRVG